MLSPQQRLRYLWLIILLLAALGLAGGAVLTLVLWPRPIVITWGHSGSGDDAAATDDATLERLGHKQALDPNAALRIGDILVTVDSAAELVHRDRALVRLAPLSDVLLGPGAPAGVDVQLRLGAMRIETSDDGPRLSIGTPVGLVETRPNTLNVLDIGIREVYVRVGEVQVQQAGRQLLIRQGHRLTIDGQVQLLGPDDPLILEELVFPVARTTPQEANITLAPLALKLLPAAGTRLSRPGLAAHVPQSPQPLVIDDLVITRREAATIALDKWGMLRLEPDSALRIAATRRAANQPDGAGAQADDSRADAVDVMLERGGASFHLDRQDAAAASLHLRIARRIVRLRPGHRVAEGHVQRRGNQLHIALHLGQLEVDNTTIEAGHRVVVDANHLVVLPLLDATAPALAGHPTVLHLPPSPLGISLTWPQSKEYPAPGGHLVEVARDANFQALRLAETLHGEQLIISPLAPGHTFFWRVDHGRVATLRAIAPPPESCAHCAGVDPITDQLRRIDVRYDTAMPQLVFSWQPRSAVDYYLFRLWRVGHLTQPVSVAHVRTPQATVDGSTLEAGDYVWKIAGYDDEGRLLHTSDVFELGIEASHEAPLNIAVPPLASTSDQNVLITHGLTRPGQTLRCNNVVLHADAEGYFEHALKLHLGRNFLFYSLSDAGVDHVFVRQVDRSVAAP